MQLLTFAHRAEAQAFFQEFELAGTAIAGFFVTSKNDLALLITGEGVSNASENLSYILGRYPEIKNVINLGVAAGLLPELEKGEIYSVRTNYYFDGLEMRFKSFSTSDSLAKIDLITSEKRVLDKTLASKLTPIAKMVDREGHALNSVCERFKITYFCYKIISDHAGLDQAEKGICEMVKEQAPFWSEKLLKHFKTLHTITKTGPAFNYPEGFYFTQTQKRIFDKYLNALSLTGAPAELVSKFAALDILPKNKTTLLLQELKKQLNPFLSSFEDKLNEAVKPLTQIGASLNFDQNYEKDDFKLNLHIQSEQDIKRLKMALELFSYERVKNILHGDF